MDRITRLLKIDKDLDSITKKAEKIIKQRDLYKKALELACYKKECTHAHTEKGSCTKPELMCNECWQDYFINKAKDTPCE
jgi:hypothetical protein